MAGKLELGQVVYVATNTVQRILPALLLEELVTRTIDGTKTTYVVQVGHDQKIKCEEDKVFPTLKKAKDVLMQRFVTALDKIIDNSEQLAVEWYGDLVKKNQEEPPPPTPPKRTSKKSSLPPPRELDLPTNPEEILAGDPEYVECVMDDGTIAKIRLPQIPQ